MPGNPPAPQSFVSSVQSVAFVSTCVPRQCGLATYSGDLRSALSALPGEPCIQAVAMNDGRSYEYSSEVVGEIRADNPRDYVQAARLLNQMDVDVVSLQHEFGIFGGEAGAHVLSLMQEIDAPIVTTLHTVLREPTPAQEMVMEEVLELSTRLVVMGQAAKAHLIESCGVDEGKVDFIPHGVPAIPHVNQEEFKAKRGIRGPLLLTFGLISPDKGIQNAIAAMPAILRDHPEAVYLIVGATHPHVKAAYGEAYRESLVKLVEDLGIQNSVRFVDRYIPMDELVELLGVMDLYVTPYLNAQQATSGTLAYAVGAGKPVISTPYQHATELLAEGVGCLVPFRSPEAIAQAALELLNDQEKLACVSAKAWQAGQEMMWPEVARRHMESFGRAKAMKGEDSRYGPLTLPFSKTEALPPVKLHHVACLTDDTGIIQHATYSIPNRSEGYCVDDNARALLLTCLLEEDGPLTSEADLWQSRYLSFVCDALNPDTLRFRNFMSYSRTWLEDAGSEDSHGRALWGLGAAATRCRSLGRSEAARRVFRLACHPVFEMTSPRAWAYAALGGCEFLKGHPRDPGVEVLVQAMAEKLESLYQRSATPEFPWFESKLAYANARLPQALIESGIALDRPEWVQLGVTSLAWLLKTQTGASGVFAPLGTQGLGPDGSPRALYDQQPLEACGAVSACLSASRATKSPEWTLEARRAMSWFMGRNSAGLKLYDQETGGCSDGLHPTRVNANQGAESTLSCLTALLELKLSAPQALSPVQKAPYVD